MKYNLFIAKRIIFNTQPSFSRFIIRLAVAASALSVAAMVVALAMTSGFQHAVSEKVFGFWGNLRVQNISPVRSMVSEESSFNADNQFENIFKKTPEIYHYQTFAIKSLILKTRDNFEGVLLKGVDKGFLQQPFNKFLTRGRSINFSDSGYSKDILLSAHTANRLSVKPGDTIQCFFIRGNSDIRSRPLMVSGIYKTGIEEYDNSFAIADIRFLQKLNRWDSSVIGGYELWITEPKKMNALASKINRSLPQNINCLSIMQLYPNIFDWLAVQDQTKEIVIGIMILVAVINLVTCLLILVMERVRMVGLLKALGMGDVGIRQIFWYYAGWISLVGVGLGVAIGLSACWLQQTTGFIKMDEATYYVSEAPIFIVGWQVALVAFGSFAVCFLSLRLPLFYVGAISPIRAIRFK